MCALQDRWASQHFHAFIHVFRVKVLLSLEVEYVGAKELAWLVLLCNWGHINSNSGDARVLLQIPILIPDNKELCSANMNYVCKVRTVFAWCIAYIAHVMNPCCGEQEKRGPHLNFDFDFDSTGISLLSITSCRCHVLRDMALQRRLEWQGAASLQHQWSPAWF